MIDTPKTDEQAKWTTFEDGMFSLEKCAPDKGRWVSIDFAREVERENTRLAKLAEQQEAEGAAMRLALEEIATNKTPHAYQPWKQDALRVLKSTTLGQDLTARLERAEAEFQDFKTKQPLIQEEVLNLLAAADKSFAGKQKALKELATAEQRLEQCQEAIKELLVTSHGSTGDKFISRTKAEAALSSIPPTGWIRIDGSLVNEMERVLRGYNAPEDFFARMIESGNVLHELSTTRAAAQKE